MTELAITKISGDGALVAAFGSAYFALTDAVSISIITSASAVFMAGISAYFAYKAKAISEQTGKAVDGHLTEFKAMAKQQFTAEGRLAGKAEEKATQAIVEKAKAEGAALQKVEPTDKVIIP